MSAQPMVRIDPVDLSSGESSDSFRAIRGLRALTDDQARSLASLLSDLELPPAALQGPDRDTRTAVTAHVSPDFLAAFKEAATAYGLSPSNLARIILTGWMSTNGMATPSGESTHQG